MSHKFRRYGKKIGWLLLDLSGCRAIAAKIHPNWIGPSSPKPSTFFLWLVGIYAALFGFARQIYENYNYRIDTRSNSIHAQLGTERWKAAISRIPSAQSITRPKETTLLDFPGVISCAFNFCDYETDQENVESWKEVMITYKESLDDVYLKNLDLSGASLLSANFQFSRLHDASFKNAFLMLANFEKAYLFNVNFSSAYLSHANFQGAFLDNVSFVGADLYSANFSEARFGDSASEKYVVDPEEITQMFNLACIHYTTRLPAGIKYPNVPTPLCKLMQNQTLFRYLPPRG